MSIKGMDWLKDKALIEDKVNKVRKLSDLAKELGISMPVLGVAWCIRNPNVSTAILGASKTSQLEENLKAIDAVDLLGQEVMERIDDILDNRPKRPAF